LQLGFANPISEILRYTGRVYVVLRKFRSVHIVITKIMVSLKRISPGFIAAAIALTSAAAIAKDVNPTPMPVIPPMPTPTPTPLVSPMPMQNPVLTTPETTPETKPEAPTEVQKSDTKKSDAKKSDVKTIVDVASASGSFKTLMAAVKAADLTETLSGPGPFTVFAPTDKAFAALPKGTLEKLLKPENKATLVKLLTYHVVSGAVESKTLKSGQVKTVEGTSMMVKVGKDGKVTVDNATVKAVDVKASNGIIHVIDQVIVPEDLKS
jgi:uncharacterized surface protein with fasciclin (FAS1) repeats